MRARKLLLAIASLVMALGMCTAVNAQTGLSSTSSYNDLPVNYVQIGTLDMNSATFTTTNSKIKKVNNYPYETSDGLVTVNTIVYNGPLTWGTANRSSSADASLGTTNVDGTFSLRYSNAATLPDGTKADVLLTFSEWKIYSGARPSSVSANQSIYMSIINATHGTEYITGNARLNTTQSVGIAATFASRITTEVKILQSGTNTPIDASKYPNMLIQWVDLDTVDKTVSLGKTDAQQFAGKFTEGVGMVSGFKSPYYLTSNTQVVSQTVDSAQKLRGTQVDTNTLDSGFIAAVSPQGYSYYWYGSIAVASADTGQHMGSFFMPSPTVNVYASAGTGGSIEKPGETVYALNGTTTYDYTPSRGYKVKTLKVNGSNVTFDADGGTYTFSKLIERSETGYDHTIDVQFEGPNVTYRWSGDAPNKTVPQGGEITPGNYTVDTTYKPGDTVTDSNGLWTFNGWDKSGTIEVYEDTVITGTWTITPYVQVTYEWDGEHPDKDVPEGSGNILKGAEYTVDTTYKKNDTVDDTNVSFGGKTYPRGTWTFNGWDRTGTIEVQEDTVIKGQWDFTPKWNITTSATNGTITESEENIPEGQNRTITYTPDEGYQLKSVTVDGESVNITQYPVSVPFENISADHEVNVVFEKIPALEVIKEVDKAICNAGDTLTYTITVRQTVEGAEARGVSLTDTLPEGLTLIEDSIEGIDVVSTSPNEYTVAIDSLTDEVTYTYQAVTDEEKDFAELINEAVATAENVPEDAKDTATSSSLTPKPEISKMVSNETPIYGEEVTYTISVKEPQDGIEVRNAVITDEIPEGVEVAGEPTLAGDEAEAVIESGKLTVTIPHLSAECVVSFPVKVVATQGKVDNIAKLNGDKVKEISDNAQLTVKEPNPFIEKEVSRQEVNPGDTVTYTITAGSDIPLLNGQIEDVCDEGIEVIKESIKCSDETATVTAEDGKIIITFEELKEQMTITYDAKIKADGTFDNVASLSAENFPKGPLTAEAEVVSEEATPMLTKKVSRTQAPVGTEVTYEIEAWAEGGTLYDAVLTDRFPDGIEVDESSITTNDENAEIKTGSDGFTLKTERLGKKKIKVTYTAEITETGKHTNTAALTASTYTGDPVKASATVTGTKQPQAAAKEKKSKPGNKTHQTGQSLPWYIWLCIMAMFASAAYVMQTFLRRMH